MKNAPGMGHFIETKTNETHSLRNFATLLFCFDQEPKRS